MLRLRPKIPHGEGNDLVLDVLHEPGLSRRHGRVPQQAQARLEGPLVKRRHVLALLAGSLLFPAVRAAEASAVPGSIARIPLGAADTAPVARLGDTRVLVMRERKQWWAIVGVPLLRSPGRR